MDKQLFRARLKETVDMSGPEIAELSEESGVEEKTITKFLEEDSDPKIDDIVRLAHVLDVDPMWLVGLETIGGGETTDQQQ